MAFHCIAWLMMTKKAERPNYAIIFNLVNLFFLLTSLFFLLPTTTKKKINSLTKLIPMMIAADNPVAD